MAGDLGGRDPVGAELPPVEQHAGPAVGHAFGSHAPKLFHDGIERCVKARHRSH